YGLGLDDSGVLYALEPDALENHYLLPFYLSQPHEMERELLASLNMGRGSASSAGGSSGIGNLFASDRYEALADFGSNKISTDDRYENKGITSYLGAGIEVPFGEKLALLAGVGYLAQKATGMSNIVVDDGGEYKPVSAYDPIEPGAVFLSDSYEYSVLNSFLNIPITVKYPFINKKVKLRGGIGLSTDIMVGHKVSSSEYSSASYQPKAMEYKPVVFSGLANLDVRYDLSESYGVAFEMGYRKGLTSIDESQQYYPSSFTAGLVLFYKIR
ncbi:MAG: outer membrane beta-barrel protein, partial [Bacteroidota bacterium]